MDLIAFYTQRQQHFQEQTEQLNRRIFWLGWLRLLVFIAAGTAVWLFFAQGNAIGVLVVGIALLILFLALVKWHIRLFEQRELTRHLTRINENECAVLHGEASYLSDGSAFQSTESYLADLDIFGHRSLFHLLNRAATPPGEARLATCLRQPLRDIAAIQAQQSAVTELASQTDFRQQFLARALRTRRHPPNYQGLLAWSDRPSEWLNSRRFQVLRIALPLLFLLALLAAALMHSLTPVVGVFILNFAVSGTYGQRVNRIHAAISDNVESLSTLADLFQLVNMQTFETDILRRIQSETAEAHQQLARLDRIARFFDQRLNIVVYVLLTGLMLYDLQCVFWLEKWKWHNKNKLHRWLASISELEMLHSLATFRFNNPDFVLPELHEGAPFIAATGLAHPLIPASERVCNDFSIGKKQRLYIITGSNMSGKSTFLRTVGVNVLLARCGAPVCAIRFACSPMAIHTSLRQSDSLQDQVSLFYAELRRLQTILQSLEQDAHALVLLDEVLRGTNSDDKLYGSQQLVRRLLSLGAAGLLATHDIELAKLETEFSDTLGNLCFESIITDDELLFDYKLKTGVAQNRNATFLMRKMNIIPKDGMPHQQTDLKHTT
ncbi:MAG TPA: hypothetical protein PKC76_07080 [Saprospiraceae bacterium]|nr:hypothetical protein [Saprospiraceae bacterium]HMP23876.1 hypothetical protein [Saprospiraceae bacterium]